METRVALKYSDVTGVPYRELGDRARQQAICHCVCHLYTSQSVVVRLITSQSVGDSYVRARRQV